MYKDSLVTIEDLSNGQIEDILDLAQEIEEDRDAFYGLAARKIIVNLFMEPSTRTSGSFQIAMKRLGGDSITVSDPEVSSMAKGETLADTIRVWSGYADMIVLRHRWEGAARMAADYSDVPVINAGDGSHEHPTQTLLDLYTLRKELGSLEGRTIHLHGDLRFGRTAHSLIYALLRFGAIVRFKADVALKPPEYLIRRIQWEYNAKIKTSYQSDVDTIVDAIYVAPSKKFKPAPSQSVQIQLDLDQKGASAIYVTRLQVERQAPGESRQISTYPKVDTEFLKNPDFSKAVILHPLPRLHELPPAVDADPRSKYFAQARAGVPVRMALSALMLGVRSWRSASAQEGVLPGKGLEILEAEGIKCVNQACVTTQEPQSTQPSFNFLRRRPGSFVCVYCERETPVPGFYSRPNGLVYYPTPRVKSRTLRLPGLRFFPDEASAVATGLRAAKNSAD